MRYAYCALRAVWLWIGSHAEYIEKITSEGP
jgi:hypothetical protein